MAPNMGQGANQAIEDAVVLAACLKAANEVSAALHSYAARRLKRANAIVQRSARIGQVAHWKRPLAVKVRNTVLKKLPSQLLLQQLDWVLKEG